MGADKKELLEKLKNKIEVEDTPYNYFYYRAEEHAAILSLLSQQEGIRWVKASERLPFSENKLEYFDTVLIPKLTYCCLKAKGLYFSAFFNHETEEFELKQNEKLTWSRKVFDEYDIYWMDESAPLSQQQQQRQYSEEDMLEAFKGGDEYGNDKLRATFKKWLKQYNNLPK